MSQVVWRIATDTPDYEADDRTGAGAKKTGGRWNEVGTPMLYASTSRALACLETVVHLNAGGLPLNRYLVQIEAPDAAMTAAEVVDPSTLVGWDAEPAGRASIRYGTDWVRSQRSLLLIAPSVIVPEEQNVLINPLHAEMSRIGVVKLRRWTYDPRLKKPA
ncbi:MAG TPA: RES family NAD+ phosphorylase [Phenylobacterium sp.]|uniref:RES family NAD+ phosphorylase n=1 Tax=Phenylobacterium sp. TaxID=1871053 RepID=UPI002B8A9AEA|nr:RES family NAD+ phosphorylase [Phenylobacterium sp.]HSV03576.1 RES family NAD+ phosphorylase [Phenylobacterium sp.]